MVVSVRGSTVTERPPFAWIPSGSKLAITLVVILMTGLVPLEHWPAQGVLLGIVFAGLSVAGVSVRYLVRRLGLFLPLLLMFGLSVPISGSSELAWNWTISLWMRCIISFLAGLWLIHVLPFPDLLSTLRRWHCPPVLIAMLGFMYRYTFILWDELRRLRNARDAREFGRSSWSRKWSSNSQMIGLLLLRAMERAERTHRAMLARGWDGAVHFLTADASEQAASIKDSVSS